MDSVLLDDATLVSRAVGGDRDAFADIYDRYAGAVLDLCTAVLRDGQAAAEATLDSFLRAAHELVNLRDRSQLRLWLLAVACHEATSGAERRPEHLPQGAGQEPTAAEPDDPRRLVWDPAEALNERDRAILHLHLRHELDGEELATVVGMRPAAAEARAAKLRAVAETSVGALLLSRADAGGEASPCPGLAEVLDGWDGRFTPAIGARIDRHARRCDACRDRRTMLLGRLRAMASLPFVPPPPWLRHEVLLRMELAVSSRTLPGWDEAGFPPGIGAPASRPPSPGRGRGRRWRRVVAAALALAVLAVAGGLLVTHDWGGDSTVSASGTSTSTSAASTSTAVAPATTVQSVTSAPVAVTAPPVPSSTTPPPVPVTPAPGPPPATPDRDPPAIAFAAGVASGYVYGCPYSRTDVVADVSDRSPITWVALFVRRPDGGEESVAMSFDGSRWLASMGDFATAGQAVYWVEAVDSEGNHARAGDQTFDVFDCT